MLGGFKIGWLISHNHLTVIDHEYIMDGDGSEDAERWTVRGKKTPNTVK